MLNGLKQKADTMTAPGMAQAYEALGRRAVPGVSTDKLFSRQARTQRKGQVSVSRLQGYAIAFVVIGVVLSVGLNVLTGVKGAMNDSTAEKGADNAIEGLNTFTEWLPLIALVVVAAIIIGLVSMFRNAGGGGQRGRA